MLRSTDFITVISQPKFGAVTKLSA